MGSLKEEVEALGRWKLIAGGTLLAGLLIGGLIGLALRPEQEQPVPIEVTKQDFGPYWGCGLLGEVPGIDKDGKVSPETQKLIDSIKVSSSYGKVNYWNWDFAPGKKQFLSSEFDFLPENWGWETFGPDKFRVRAGTQGFPAPGLVGANWTHAQMGELFMGSNEPDIAGSCMADDSFGYCLRPCKPETSAAGQCARNWVNNSNGECWCDGPLTGVGWLNINHPKCANHDWQPLPTLFKDDKPQRCADYVMEHWRAQAAYVVDGLGFKYLSTPLVSYDTKWVDDWLSRACTAYCQEASCGCPQYVGFHFYAYDCMPEDSGSYTGFRARLDEVGELMMKYPSLKGAIINEVGMLNCGKWTATTPICVPNTGNYPANSTPTGDCPVTPELPRGLSSFMDGLFEIMKTRKTRDGRLIAKQFSWFMLNKDGGTYNQQIFTPDKKLNALGESYRTNCEAWGKVLKEEADRR